MQAQQLTEKALEGASKQELRNPQRGKYFRIISEVCIDGEYKSEIEKMLIHILNRETIEQKLKTEQRPKRVQGGFGQWIADRFGHDLDTESSVPVAM